MRIVSTALAMCIAVSAVGVAAADNRARNETAHVGPRPFYLVDEMSPGALKTELQRCAATTKRYRPTIWSIGHRGAPLKFPEHTRESYVAAARMGAGILECDVTFTSDGELVCRHAQCDLHTTTNILATDLAAKCSEPFTPADPVAGTPASARCCASDITLEEFKSLEGKMDAADRNATTVEAYLNGTANWRTDLYATGGTLLSHAESIELFRDLRRGFTPELKSADPAALADAGLNQQSYARKLIQEYIAAGIPARRVWAQSFNFDDVKLWIDEFPDYGEQAVFLDGRNVAGLAENPPSVSDFRALKEMGLNIIAPPMPVLLRTRNNGSIVPSRYANRARRAGLDIISWTTERSGRINEDVLGGGSTFYYQTTLDALENDGDILTTMDVLAQDVGIIGLFSDWPATTTFYANCKKVNTGRSGR